MTLRTCDIANALNADPTLISRWRRRGMPDTDLESARAWHAANIKPRRRISARTGYARPAAPPAAEPHTEGAELAPEAASLTRQLLAARVLREQSEADSAAIRLAELQRRVVRVDDVIRHWGDQLTVCRTRLLNIANRIAPQVPPEHYRLVFDAVTSEVHGALTDLSRTNGVPAEAAK